MVGSTILKFGTKKQNDYLNDLSKGDIISNNRINAGSNINQIETYRETNNGFIINGKKSGLH